MTWEISQVFVVVQAEIPDCVIDFRGTVNRSAVKISLSVFVKESVKFLLTSLRVRNE